LHLSMEVRSLNNRYFKAIIRMPEEIAGLEAELETALRKQVSRGSVTVTVKMRDASADAAHEVNDEALITYLQHLEELGKRFKNQDEKVNIDLTALLALPGVMQPTTSHENLLETVRPVLLGMLDASCAKLLTMRTTEGEALSKDLRKHSEVMAERMKTIRQRAPHVVEEYHKRLRARIDDLAKRAELKIDEKDLLREVAIFAERADIAEEINRMDGHLTQFAEILGNTSKEPSGRTLEFVAQEMLREANTIASKSNDASISRSVVDVKGAIDRIREQAQNVE